MVNLDNEIILITGSNSFVAYNLMRKLQNTGAEVFGLSRSDNQNVDMLNNDHFAKVNVNDFNHLSKIVKQINPTIVFHLASEMAKSMETLEKSIAVNVVGTLNLIKALEDSPLKNFITFCTGEIYSGEVPYNEKSITIPKSAYSLSRYQATLLLQCFYNLKRIPITILRPSVVYGPKQKSGMFIPSIILSVISNEKFIMTPGEQTRDFVYIGDLVDSMIKAIGNKNCLGEIINIGSGKEHTIKEVAQKIMEILCKDKKLLNCSMPYRQNEQMRYVFDITKAKKIMEWQPTTSLEEGLKKTIEWYAKNGR